MTDIDTEVRAAEPSDEDLAQIAMNAHAADEARLRAEARARHPSSRHYDVTDKAAPDDDAYTTLLENRDPAVPSFPVLLARAARTLQLAEYAWDDPDARGFWFRVSEQWTILADLQRSALR